MTDSDGRVKVIIRSRPTVNFATKNLQIDETTGDVNINIPKDERHGHVNHQQENWNFRFQKILQNASQEVVFDVVGKDIVQTALEGYSGTVLCYGQTGAGKTFTMTGSTQDYRYRGIIPRAIHMLYSQISERYEKEIIVRVSYLEIYQEQLSDLLSDAYPLEQSQNLAIQEDAIGFIQVKGLIQKICHTEEEALGLLFEGDTNRTLAEHKLNKTSTRSHCIYTLLLEIRSRVESSEKVIFSKINLVDLAGSERTKKTGSEGKQLKEAQFINKSLSFLEQVVVALSDKSRSHIPYRQSKLTNILKDSIGGNCKTVMIANVWPEQKHLEETISTLKFASRMKRVSNKATVNIQLDPAILLKKQEREIRDLKLELAMHDTLAGRGRITYDPYTPEEQKVQEDIAMKYLEGEIQDIEIESLRQVKELFIQMRNKYKWLKNDIKTNQVERQVSQKEDDQVRRQTVIIDKQGTKHVIDQVGSQENKHGFGVGKAPKDAKPSNQLQMSMKKDGQDVGGDQPPLEQDEEVKSEFEGDQKQQKNLLVDKNDIFKEWKEQEGKELNTMILGSIDKLRNQKMEIKKTAKALMDIKIQIAVLKQNIQRKQMGKAQEEIDRGIIDEEEFQFIRDLKKEKQIYKQMSGELKKKKIFIKELDQEIRRYKYLLLTRFDEWYQVRYGKNIQDMQVDRQALLQRPQSEGKSDTMSEDVDSDAQAYVKAMHKTSALQQARRNERMGRYI